MLLFVCLWFICVVIQAIRYNESNACGVAANLVLNEYERKRERERESEKEQMRPEQKLCLLLAHDIRYDSLMSFERQYADEMIAKAWIRIEASCCVPFLLVAFTKR